MRTMSGLLLLFRTRLFLYLNPGSLASHVRLRR